MSIQKRRADSAKLITKVLPKHLPIGSAVWIRLPIFYPIDIRQRERYWKPGYVIEYDEKATYMSAQKMRTDEDYSMMDEMPAQHVGQKGVWVGLQSNRKHGRADRELGGKLMPYIKYCVPYTADFVVPRKLRPDEIALDVLKRSKLPPKPKKKEDHENK